MSDKIREATLEAIEKKWTEAARLGCVDSFPSALNEAWQSALAQQPAPAVPEDLRARCAEILAWQKTGVLKGDALRGYARAQWYADEHNSLQMAEADTARQAYAFLVATPPSSAQEPVPVYLVLAEEDYEAPIVLRAFSDKGAAEGFAHALRDYQQDRPEWPVGDADLEEIQESDEKIRAWMAAHPGGEDAAWRRFLSVLPVPFSAAPPAAEHPGTVRVPVEAMQRIHNTLDACQKVIWLAGCRPRGYGFDPVYVSDAQDRLKEIEAMLGKEGEA